VVVGAATRVSRADRPAFVVGPLKTLQPTSETDPMSDARTRRRFIPSGPQACGKRPAAGRHPGSSTPVWSGSNVTTWSTSRSAANTPAADEAEGRPRTDPGGAMQPLVPFDHINIDIDRALSSSTDPDDTPASV